MSNVFLFWHSYSCPKKQAWRKYTLHSLEFILKKKKQLATIKRWRNLVRLETSVNYHHSIIPCFSFASSNLKVALKLSAEGLWAQPLISTIAPTFEANKENILPSLQASPIQQGGSKKRRKERKQGISLWCSEYTGTGRGLGDAPTPNYPSYRQGN